MFREGCGGARSAAHVAPSRMSQYPPTVPYAFNRMSSGPLATSASNIGLLFKGPGPKHSTTGFSGVIRVILARRPENPKTTRTELCQEEKINDFVNFRTQSSILALQIFEISPCGVAMLARRAGRLQDEQLAPGRSVPARWLLCQP